MLFAHEESKVFFPITTMFDQRARFKKAMFSELVAQHSSHMDIYKQRLEWSL
jgi:hypothetical protein